MHNTAPSSPPISVIGHVQSSTIVVFSWLPPLLIDQNGVIINYVVKLSEIETNISWTFVVMTENITIDSLHPYYHYNCTVAAGTVAGTGPYSAPITVLTEEAGLLSCLNNIVYIHVTYL